MERFWLSSYPPGVPTDIDTTRYPSLVDLYAESFRTFHDQPAFVCMDKTLTFGEVDKLSRDFAAYLQSLGLQKGARVALMMPNVLPYAIGIAAVLRAGYVVVNVNPLYTPRELAHQLKDSGAEAIVVLENFALTVQRALEGTALKHIIVATMGDLFGLIKGTIINLVVRHKKKMVPAYSLPQAVSFMTALSQGHKLPLNSANVGPDDIAFLQYTGGTTGVSKGAMLLHRNVVANTLQVEQWLNPAYRELPADTAKIITTALPLYHIFALTACYFTGLRVGALCNLIPNPRDLPAVISELRKYPPTQFPAVNTLYNALLHHPDFRNANLKLLRAAVGGGMAVQRTVAERWLTQTGCPLLEGYGLSETSPVLTCTSALAKAWDGTVGLPMPSTEISIRGENGEELPVGEVGEICARGPQVMAGYWGRPDDTKRTMTADGFFKTGDIGVFTPDGRVRLVDRKKDMILISGFNVYPNEVEDVLAAHPGVMECAVIGVPDEHSGEIVKAFVVKKDPALTAEELRKYAATQLTGYKVPKIIEFRAELPKTNVGKILRRALRDDNAKPMA